MVQLSDLHVGPRVDDEYLIETLERVKTLQADILVFTGDFVSWGSARQQDHLARVFRHTPTGRLATLGILGNHDYGPNWNHLDIADNVVRTLDQVGIRVLRNESTVVLGLKFYGLDDLWSPRFGPGHLFTGIDPKEPAIALCHNPDGCDENVWGDFQGYILSGHTHGGQCKPPFLPPPFLPVRNRRYSAGEFDLYDGRTLYVNRGIGHLLRVRFNVRPEITLFTLTRA